MARFSLRASSPFERPITIRAAARHEGSGRLSQNGYQVIDYPHIRRDALLHVAEIKVVPFRCQLPDGRRQVGYIEGPGDDVITAIQSLGLRPTLLDAEELLRGDLARFDVIVTGVRAYKTREDLKSAQHRLREWVQSGGTLIVQYNKLEFNDGEDSSPFAPLRGARVGRRRVTVESSAVEVKFPGHPLFTTPNSIGPRDWQGWVQERGLYFLELTNENYEDLLVLQDPWPYNPALQGGAFVHARLGQGHWVYVGIGLFRQLPAGVPGAYRLLANLLAL
jgi:hypothetical protein